MQSSTRVSRIKLSTTNATLRPHTAREIATGRQVAIKKIKVGQFKDGLDMSAVREVKYLRELQHPNVIAVSFVSWPLFP